ncbi:MAG TPA: prolipoprotein diacylglyceryl transferase family protein [Stellaceae bacterium]|nr:prolipoprotein diacylglyceryl transferase family protein [Stellaceae bacterium]
MLPHSLFDILAAMAAVLAYRVVPVAAAPVPWRSHRGWLVAASIGASTGAYLFGSLNLWLSGVSGFGRSIEGAIAGGILAIELYKRRAGIVGSTGIRLVAPLAAAIVVGRIGCFLAGLDDMTYGTPTALPWGVDFGDGIRRHPVQLYEAAAMAVFLAVFVAWLREGMAGRIGFYLFVLAYAAQRFAWEFLKPYAAIIGPFNLFHLLSAALVAYALIFIRREAQSPWTMSASPRTP